LSDEKRFLLRLDPSLFRALRKWADDDLRSVNGQIEFLLRKALKEAGRLKAPGGGGGGGSRSGPDEAD
jgi:hypothetical protein